MRAYLEVLRITDFRTLWLGAVISLIGDGASWIAMSWIAVTDGGARSLTVLGVCYTGPVVAGGLIAGKIVDRLPRRLILVVDCVIRGLTMLAVPLLASSGEFSLWNLYLVAAVYGLLKILPIGILPAVIPDLVPERKLSTAIALESMAASATGLVGPAVGGILISLVSPYWVLAADAATYFAFAAAVLTVTAGLDRPPSAPDAAGPAASGSWTPVIAFLRGDRVMLVITVAFTLFNVAMGMLVVAQPWLAHERLPGGAAMLGILVGVLAAAETAGSLVAGAIKPAARPMARIGALQLLAGAGLLLLLDVSPVPVLAGQVVCGLPAALLVVSSQAVRYERTPEELRGRTMTLMRTLMLSALPAGSAMGGLLLASGGYTVAVVVMAVLAGVPGLLSLRVGVRAVNQPDANPETLSMAVVPGQAWNTEKEVG